MNPDQKSQIDNWVVQRDTILSDISNLQTEKEKLVVTNKSIAESNTEIETRMNVVLGRIEELKKKEVDLIPLISKEVASLQSQKNVLEAEVTDLKNVVAILVPQKNQLEVSISFLMETYNSINAQVGLLDKVVGHVTEVSNKNAATIQDMMTSVTTSTKAIVDKNTEITERANEVIRDLPKVFLEVQRKSLVRQKVN